MLQDQESQMSVLSVLVSADRKELSKAFGVGMYITDSDTVEQVKNKCNCYIERYKKYINNLNAVLDIPDVDLKSEMHKAKAFRYFNSLNEDDKKALRGLIINIQKNFKHQASFGQPFLFINYGIQEVQK